jgi:hypothetical protein
VVRNFGLSHATPSVACDITENRYTDDAPLDGAEIDADGAGLDADREYSPADFGFDPADFHVNPEDLDPDDDDELLDDAWREPESLGPFLPPETWGDRMHRAYRIARRNHGPSFTYRAVAERISEFEPTADVSILRLEARREFPREHRLRRVALYCVCLYGFDPAGFGVRPEMFSPFEWYDAHILWEEQKRWRWRPARAGR